MAIRLCRRRSLMPLCKGEQVSGWRQVACSSLLRHAYNQFIHYITGKTTRILHPPHQLSIGTGIMRYADFVLFEDVAALSVDSVAVDKPTLHPTASVEV